MKTHTIIVWENIPDNLTIYVVPNDALSAEQHALINLAHGCFINVDNWEENKGLAFLNVAVADKTEQSIEDNKLERYAEYLGVLAGYRAYSTSTGGFVKNLQQVFKQSNKDGIFVNNIICTGFLA